MLLSASTVRFVLAHLLSCSPCSSCRPALLAPWERLFSGSLGFISVWVITPHSFPRCISAPQTTKSSSLFLWRASKSQSTFLMDFPLVSQDVAFPIITIILLSLNKIKCSSSLNFFQWLSFLSILALIGSLNFIEIVVYYQFLIKLAFLKLHSFNHFIMSATIYWILAMGWIRQAQPWLFVKFTIQLGKQVNKQSQ